MTSPIILLLQVVESCKAKTRKPEPLIYQKVLDELNITGPEAVFLDDLGQNLKAAAKFGIKTIRVRFFCLKYFYWSLLVLFFIYILRLSCDICVF